MELGFSDNLNAILRKLVVAEEFFPLKKWNMLLTIRDFAPNERLQVATTSKAP